MQNRIDKIVEAIVYVDNEALRLRDEAKAARDIPERFKSLMFQKRELYTAKKTALEVMSEQNLICTTGYVLQGLEGFKTRIYQNKVVGDDGEAVITSLKPYTKTLEHKDNKLGTTTGLMYHRELETDLDTEEALSIISDYIQSCSAEQYRDDKDISENIAAVPEHPVKETKLVKLSKVIAVKDTDRDTDQYESEKARIISAIECNKGRYPKSEALLVRKRKDSEDKRRVVYHLEEGLMRYTVAQDLGLLDIQVSIIDEELN